jgi:hypothetical protein
MSPKWAVVPCNNIADIRSSAQPADDVQVLVTSNYVVGMGSCTGSGITHWYGPAGRVGLEGEVGWEGELGGLVVNERADATSCRTSSGQGMTIWSSITRDVCHSYMEHQATS